MPSILLARTSISSYITHLSIFLVSKILLQRIASFCTLQWASNSRSISTRVFSPLFKYVCHRYCKIICCIMTFYSNIKIWIKFITYYDQPEHSCSLQFSWIVLVPSHFPLLDSSNVFCLEFLLVPPPHDLEQSPISQFPHSQSIGSSKWQTWA